MGCFYDWEREQFNQYKYNGWRWSINLKVDTKLYHEPFLEDGCLSITLILKSLCSCVPTHSGHGAYNTSLLLEKKCFVDFPMRARLLEPKTKTLTAAASALILVFLLRCIGVAGTDWARGGGAVAVVAPSRLLRLRCHTIFDMSGISTVFHWMS